jgi:hypothetical protein
MPPTPVGELPDGQVAAHLESDHEEEHDHQAVVDPVAEAHLQGGVAESEGDEALPECVVAVRPW